MRAHRSRESEQSPLSTDKSVSRRSFLRSALIGAGASLLAGCSAQGLLGAGRKLRVWSCGGNYDLLCEFGEWFESKYGCRVSYSSAPVERLVSLIAAHPRKVDLLVGRSGPGWNELQEKGRLAAPPRVFALDTYVIIVPLGNPAGVKGLADLKRPGLRTVYSPRASGPSSLAVQAVLEAADAVIEPGIWEGYVNNAVAAYDCGWKVFDAVIEGLAEATVARLSMTTAAETRGKVEVIPIPVKVMAAMRSSHGAIPQRATVLTDAPEPELAAAYLELLFGDPGREHCERHGYVHLLAENAEEYRALFQMGVGKGGGRKGRAQRGAPETEGPSSEEARREGRGRAARARGRRTEE